MTGKNIVTGAARREAVQCLLTRGLSPRRAWVLLQRHRSTRSDRERPDRHAALAAPVDALAHRPPRSGDRRVWAWRRRRGQRVHQTHGPRLWTRATLQVRTITRQRGPARAASIPVQARQPGPVWTDDFLHDHGLKGTPLTVLTGMDEWTRAALAIEVAPSLPSQRVLTILERLVATPGAPEFIRSDHGPECIALVIRGWLAQPQTRTLSIDPGCPWQNGYGASFNGTGRDEGLNMHVLLSGAEARVMLTAYRQPYHEERPHRRVGYRTPAEFTRDWRERESPSGGLSHFHWPKLLGACHMACSIRMLREEIRRLVACSSGVSSPPRGVFLGWKLVMPGR